MYEMRAEHDPRAGEESARLWHVMDSADTATTMCGRQLTPQTGPQDVTVPGDHYCSACLAAVGHAMEARNTRTQAGDSPATSTA